MADWVDKIKEADRRVEMAAEECTSELRILEDGGLISLDEVLYATDKMNEGRVIGDGGFGKVYKGELRCGTKVAVKWKKMACWQGEKEFQAEIELSSRLKHPNLVDLIGYCDEENEMILVYKYMENGTLKSHLYGSDKPSLNWTQRLEACVGAARGLHYLHTSSEKGIIHRDVKSDNILLDEKLCAKIADFGLSKDGPGLNENYVITQVKGTLGYLDPEYYQTELLTEKSDVYSFGVVLLEVLCGRKVIDHDLSADKVSLVRWGKKMLVEGRVEEIVDKKILGTINPHYLTMFGDIVLKCLAEERVERPTMAEVLKDLERELEYVRACVDAGNSDGESHHAISSQPVGTRRILERCDAKNFRRTSRVPHHDISAPSTSWVAWVMSSFLGCNTKNDRW